MAACGEREVSMAAGALCAVLGGLDVLTFSAGIGEHDPATRAQVCQGLAWLGIALDAPANEAAIGASVGAPMVPLHAPHSAIEVWVVPTDEGLVAAREAAALLGLTGAAAPTASA